MTQLTDKRFAIPMPKGAESCEIRGAHPGRPYPLLSFYGEGEAVILPPGEYQILVFNTGTATEEDARKAVKCNQDFVRGAKVQMAFYENYEGKHSSFPSAISSLKSLLRSKGLNPDNNYAIIEKLSSDE